MSKVPHVLVVDDEPSTRADAGDVPGAARAHARPRAPAGVGGSLGMSLETMIPRDAVAVPLRATQMEEALVELSGLLARAHALQVDQVLRPLQERERLGSTSIGEGIALPHGRAGVERTVGALGISPGGIRWGSELVHIVIAVLSPLEGSEHVKALARIGRLFADGRSAELRRMSSAAQAHAVLVAADA